MTQKHYRLNTTERKDEMPLRELREVRELNGIPKNEVGSGSSEHALAGIDRAEFSIDREERIAYMKDAIDFDILGVALNA